jgi:hypothetical protein
MELPIGKRQCHDRIVLEVTVDTDALRIRKLMAALMQSGGKWLGAIVSVTGEIWSVMTSRLQTGLLTDIVCRIIRT